LFSLNLYILLYSGTHMFSFVAMVTQLYQICGYFIFNGLSYGCLIIL